MIILHLDLKDGHGRIQVVVEDVMDAERLRKFVSEGITAISEKNELEMGFAP